jgi:RNA polymerase sigma-70 factor (ECF subfamily)
VTPDQEQRAAALMQQTQAGDQAAYADLLTMLSREARIFARARLGAAAWVDDVVQETLLAIHGARHTYDVRRPFAPWFFAITAHRLIDVVRRERRVAGREIGSDTLPEPGSEDADGRSGIDPELIRRALDSLPPKQRAIVEALKYRDESVREVAGKLGMSESAVKVAAHRGYRAMRRLLGHARGWHKP